MSLRPLILTRATDLAHPSERPASWALTQAQATSWQLVHWPLIEVAPVADEPTLAQLHQVWRPDSPWQAVFFVSAGAARHFFAHQPKGRAWPDWSAWCTGPATAQVLRELGVPESCLVHPNLTDGQWDSESLWPRVSPGVQAGTRVLRVRGRDAAMGPVEGEGRDWLGDQLRARGAIVTSVAAYERRLPVWLPAQRAQALKALSDGSVWWFSSAQAVRNLHTLLEGAAVSQALAVATHERIAQACRRWGWSQVQVCRPDVESVMKSIESFQ
jgi:uroporphyrinogen-III synthase